LHSEIPQIGPVCNLSRDPSCFRNYNEKFDSLTFRKYLAKSWKLNRDIFFRENTYSFYSLYFSYIPFIIYGQVILEGNSGEEKERKRKRGREWKLKE